MPFVFAVAPHHPLASHEGPIRRRPAALPRRGGGRFGPAPVAAHGQPAAGAGRADRQHHGRQDRGAAARPGLRLRARALVRRWSTAAAWWSSRRSAARRRPRWATPGAARRAQGRAPAAAGPGPAVVAAAAGQPTTRKALLEPGTGSARRRLTRCATAAASRRRPPGRCTPARWSPRWPAGSTPARRADAGWCASRTSTARAAAAGMAEVILASCSAAAWCRRDRCGSPPATRLCEALERLVAAAWPTPAPARARTSTPRSQAQGMPHERHGERVYPGTCRRACRASRRAPGGCAPTRPPRAPVHRVGSTAAWARRAGRDPRWATSCCAAPTACGPTSSRWWSTTPAGHHHVVRGEDLADNTPRQILLQRALGLPTPRYLHTPLVLAPTATSSASRTARRAGPGRSAGRAARSRACWACRAARPHTGRWLGSWPCLAWRAAMVA
jgi:hypothetical protein